MPATEQPSCCGVRKLPVSLRVMCCVGAQQREGFKPVPVKPEHKDRQLNIVPEERLSTGHPRGAHVSTVYTALTLINDLLSTNVPGEQILTIKFFLFESSFICKLYRYCKITRGMKRSAQ
jgi:hypothetical protein